MIYPDVSLPPSLYPAQCIPPPFPSHCFVIACFPMIYPDVSLPPSLYPAQCIPPTPPSHLSLIACFPTVSPDMFLPSLLLSTQHSVYLHHLPPISPSLPAFLQYLSICSSPPSFSLPSTVYTSNSSLPSLPHCLLAYSISRMFLPSLAGCLVPCPGRDDFRCADPVLVSATRLRRPVKVTSAVFARNQPGKFSLPGKDTTTE